MKTLRNTLVVLMILTFIHPLAAQDLKVIKKSPNLTIVEGSGGNSGILVTDQAVVVIDTKMGDGATQLHDLVNQLAGNKEIIVINTHDHPDHVSGNHLYTKCTKYIGAYSTDEMNQDISPEDMPNTLVKDSIVLDLGSESVVMYNFGQNHTWQDVVVLLKKNKVLFTGDLIFYKTIPFIIKESGADVNNWIRSLNKILKWNNYTTLVPGHGEPGGKEIARAIKGYLEDMRMAAKDPSKEKAMVDKYKDWSASPGRATSEINIRVIREEERK